MTSVISSPGFPKLPPEVVKKRRMSCCLWSTTNSIVWRRYHGTRAARRSNFSEKSDLFSLGLVFYEMVTGRSAFEGDRTSRIRAEDAERVSSPSELVAQLDPRFESVILRCLREDPGE